MLHVIDLYKRYDDAIALDGVNVRVRSGETVVIMGPSGCGKSTLLHAIERFVVPDAGDVRFEGRSVFSMSEEEMRSVRRRIGFVFQHVHLIARLNVLDNVQFGLVLGGMDAAEAEARAVEALDTVGLGQLQHRHPLQLSGGQQQRVAIARALAGSPALMLWDEPTAALDPVLVGEVLDIMEQLARERRTGMLVVTHEVQFARRVADRILLMDEGKIVEEGPAERVLFAPRSELGRRYKRLLVR